MRASSSINFFWILSKSFFEFPSNLNTNFGVVLEALIKPHPLSKFILSPSIVIFSPFNKQFLENSSIILNLFSSVTLMFSYGVENNFGSFLFIDEILLLFFDISSMILAPE